MLPFYLTYIFAFAASGLFGPLVPAALLNAGFTAGAVANAVAAQNTVRVIAPTLWGRMADLSAQPKLIAAGSFAFGALCYALIAFAGTPLWLALAYAVLGFGGSSGVPVTDGLVLSTLERRNEDRARFGRVRVFGTLGFALSTLAVGVIRDRGGELRLMPPQVLYPAAVLALAAAVCIATARAPGAHTAAAGATRFLDLAKNRRYLLLLAFAFFHWASHMTYTVFVVPLGEARGLSALVVAVSIVVGLLVEALLMRQSGRVQRRIGGRAALLFTGAVGALRWIGFAIDFGSPEANAAAFLFFSACHGLSFGFFYPVIVSLIADAVGAERRHSALSVVFAIAFGLGGAAGASAGGHLLEAYGTGGAWLAMVPFSIVAIVLGWRATDSPHPTAQSA